MSSFYISCTLSLAEFLRDRSQFGNIVHLKGFGGGLKALEWKKHVLAAVGDACDTLAFDGDPMKIDSFTAIVPDFLRLNVKHRVIAFRDSKNLDSFEQSWAAQIKEFGDRLIVVLVDIEADAVILGLPLGSLASDHICKPDKFYLLGRIAIKATGAKLVVAAGGGGIAAREAKASISEGTSWTVLALSRGKTEKHETLLDWARDNPNQPGVKFVQGIDANEAQGYKVNKRMKFWAIIQRICCAA